MEASSASYKKTKVCYFNFSLSFFLIGLSLLFVPTQSAFATSGIANTVMGFCAPTPTVPDVGSCSACHMTTNESVNDLNAAGMQAQAGNYVFFCPNTTPTPTTPPTTPTTPPPGAPGSTPPDTGMGMGLGADDDDDDDDEAEMDDDDDSPAPASALNALRSLLSDL